MQTLHKGLVRSFVAVINGMNQVFVQCTRVETMTRVHY